MRIALLLLLPVLPALAEERLTHRRLTFVVPEGWEVSENTDRVVMVPKDAKPGNDPPSLVVSGTQERKTELKEYAAQQLKLMKRQANWTSGTRIKETGPEEREAVSGCAAMSIEISYTSQGSDITLFLLMVDLGDSFQQAGFACAAAKDVKKTRKASDALVKSLQVAERKEAEGDKSQTALFVALEKVRHRDVRSGNFEFRYYPRVRLFLPEGHVCRELPLGGLSAFEWERARKDKPAACGSWEQVKGGFEVTWADGVEDLEWGQGGQEALANDDLVFERCDLSPDGRTLEGTWSLSSFVDTSDPSGEGGVASEDAITFQSDGTFSAEKFVGHAASRESAEGGVFGESEREASSGSGTYSIRAGTLGLEFEDGSVSKQTFYLFPKNAKEATPGRIVIDGRSYLRR